MAEIRLSKLTKQFSIGLARLVDFLNEKGANVEMNPNAKISDEYLPAIEAKFGEDLKLKKDSEKVTIKLKEIIEMNSKKKATAQEDDDIPEKEVVIKTNTLADEKPVVQETPAPAPAPKEEVKVEVKEEPKVEAKAEPKREEKGPKIIDKIDLSKFDKKPAAPVQEEKPVEPEPVAAPTPAEEPVKPVVVEPTPAPVAEVEAKAEPREIKVEVERLAGPKVDRKSVV